MKPEYVVGNRRVDYALFIGGTAKVFVEVKKGRGSLWSSTRNSSSITRLKRGYRLRSSPTERCGGSICQSSPSAGNKRKFATISLDGREKAEIVHVLADVLGQENVNNGNAFDNAERLYHQAPAAKPNFGDDAEGVESTYWRE